MRKVLLALAFLVSFFTAFTAPSLAVVVAGSNLTVGTSVLDPQSNSYVDSLGLTDSMYHPNDIVTFHITISNNGDSAVSSVNVQNVLPDYVTFTAGPGAFDNASHTLSFTVPSIAPHTSRSYAISGQINNPSSLPTNQGVVCVADKTNAQTPEPKTMQSAASFCIQKVFPATQTQTTPATGPEMIDFLSIVLSGTAGFVLKKIAKQG